MTSELERAVASEEPDEVLPCGCRTWERGGAMATLLCGSQVGESGGAMGVACDGVRVRMRRAGAAHEAWSKVREARMGDVARLQEQLLRDERLGRAAEAALQATMDQG